MKHNEATTTHKRAHIFKVFQFKSIFQQMFLGWALLCLHEADYKASGHWTSAQRTQLSLHMCSIFAHRNSDVKLITSSWLILTFPHIKSAKEVVLTQCVCSFTSWKTQKCEKSEQEEAVKVLSGSRWSRRPTKFYLKDVMISSGARSAHLTLK